MVNSVDTWSVVDRFFAKLPVLQIAAQLTIHHQHILGMDMIMDDGRG